MSSKGARVSSISNSVSKMIQDIKEITGSHEDEIYATLKECSMDPNETAQKLLSQDTFHEVKRKRDRRKEHLSNKESIELRWKPGLQGHGSREGRGSHSSRYVSNDTGGGNSSIGKESTSIQVSEKSNGLSLLPASQKTKKTETAVTLSSISVKTNGPASIAAKSTKVNTSSSQNSSASETQVTSPGIHFSASDPVLVLSNDSRNSGAMDTIKCEVGCQRTLAEQISLVPSEGKSVDATSEVNSNMKGNIQNKSCGKNQLSDAAQRPSSAHGGSSVTRPSSNHSSRPQQVVGPQKVGSGKEWKPKPTYPNLAQGSTATVQSEVPAALGDNTQSHLVTGDLDSKEATSKLQRKLEELQVSDAQHVIIPNHLHIPAAEKISFCFGSFDAISLDMGFKNVSHDSNPKPTPEISQCVEETVDQSSSLQNAFVTVDKRGYVECPQSPGQVPESSSPGEHDLPSAVTQEHSESKKESDLPQGSHQYSIIHTSPSYSFGLMPSMIGSQVAPFESTESQTREASRVPSFVVPQAFDPTSYYAQFYYPSADGEGRISPFHSAGVATKYNGSVAVLSQQTSQSAQEGVNSLVMSTTGPTAFVTQPNAGVMQSSIAVTQHPVHPVLRQPTGIPISHYPPNFIPYGHYFSPYFIPSPIHHFVTNTAYPQQTQGGNVYPVQPGLSAKFSLPQYKASFNSGNSTSIGAASSYGPYSSSSAAGNSTNNEDLTTSQSKENNGYITGQQSEGSAVWFTQPGRDISGVQASSLYNIPSQGQVTFPPQAVGHGPFSGIYHTAQAVPAAMGHPLLQQQSQTVASVGDIVGPAPSVYPQPQHAQVNWPNN